MAHVNDFGIEDLPGGLTFVVADILVQRLRSATSQFQHGAGLRGNLHQGYALEVGAVRGGRTSPCQGELSSQVFSREIFASAANASTLETVMRKEPHVGGDPVRTDPSVRVLRCISAAER